MASPGLAQTAVTERVLGPDALGDPVVWLPASIDNGTFAARVAMAARVPLIFEAAGFASSAPSQRVTLMGKTVRESLDAWVAADARYTWSEVNGVLVIRPLAAVSDPHDPLNQPITNVTWSNISVPQALNGVIALFSGFTAQPGVTDAPFDNEVFSVAVPSGTVLDVLVEAARAHGSLIWSTPDTTQRSGQPGFSVGVATFSGRGIGATMPVLP
jgi:hypothetical protein